MNPSILTLRELQFIRVRIEIDFEVKVKPAEFYFEGALLGWNITHGRKTDSENQWWVAVGFSNSNEGEAKCPYLLDVQAIGVIDIDNNATNENERERIVYESGAALVYGAIREMVSTVTGRCLPGALMLPTPTFIGAFAERKQPPDEAAPGGDDPT